MITLKVNIVGVRKEIDALEAEFSDLKVKMRDHLKELGLNV